MDIREELKRWLVLLTQIAGESDSKTIKQDIDLLTGVSGQLVTELVNRNAALARQKQPRRVKPPKSAPQKDPKKQKAQSSYSVTPQAQNDAEDRSKALSSIQQGIRQADPSLADEQRALRQQIYGKQNPDVAFTKAAQAIVS